MLWGISAARGLPWRQTARALPKRQPSCAVESEHLQASSGQLRAVSRRLAWGAADYQACCLTFKRAARRNGRALVTQGGHHGKRFLLEQAALLENIARQIVKQHCIYKLRPVRRSAKLWRRWFD